MVDTLVVSAENAQTCIDIADNALQYVRGTRIAYLRCKLSILVLNNGLTIVERLRNEG